MYVGSQFFSLIKSALCELYFLSVIVVLCCIDFLSISVSELSYVCICMNVYMYVFSPDNDEAAIVNGSTVPLSSQLNDLSTNEEAVPNTVMTHPLPVSNAHILPYICGDQCFKFSCLYKIFC